MTSASDTAEDTLHQKCDRCGVIGQDRRTLFMACLFEMSELGVPFKPVGFMVRPMRFIGRDDTFGFPQFEPVYSADGDGEYSKSFYTLTVCKGCRGAWLEAIVHWFRNPTETYLSLNNDENIPARQSLAELLADAERLRTDLVAIQRRIDVLLPELRLAHDSYDNLRLKSP